MKKSSSSRLGIVLRIVVFPYLLFYAGAAMAFSGTVNIPEDESTRRRWEIVIDHGSKREFIYTNKVATHFSAEAADENSRSYHGLYCAMYEYVDSWNLEVQSGVLTGDDITQAFAYPHTIYRFYGKAGIMEEIFLPDRRNGLIVVFTGALPADCSLIPWVDMRFIWKVPEPDYRVFWLVEENALLVSRLSGNPPSGRPVWIAITSNVPLDFEFDERKERKTYWRDAARRAMAEANPFSPGRLRFEGNRGEGAVFSFGLGADWNEAIAEARFILKNFEKLKEEKLHRIESLFYRANIETSDERINRAYRWARVSMDNLIMNQRGRGIYAGFHWFPNYWGRDTFISLPGACLVTGEFDTAKEILLSFMEFQDREGGSPFLGRFPNIVNPGELQFSGVDGTWWLVRAAWKYYEESKDVDFLVRAFPSVSLAIEGALGKAVDSLGFLTHGDHETWMDAGGEAHPYTPRGNRAVEVQALFYNGLMTGVKWAMELKERYKLCDRGLDKNGIPNRRELDAVSSRWRKHAAKLRSNFIEHFWDEDDGYLYDHIRSDGTPAKEIRPNAILALWVAGYDLVPEDRFKVVVETALDNVCFSHGVLSLSPSDGNFHPYHLNFKDYFFDEAYHNGDAWEWLAGPMVSCLVRVGMVETAWELVSPLVGEILDEACVGSLREIRDGVYIPGKEEFGGATSQAWSLAEFIRVFHEEFLGVRGAPGTSDEGGQKDEYRGAFPRPGGQESGIEVTASRIPAGWGATRYSMPLVVCSSNSCEDRRVVVVTGKTKPSRMRGKWRHLRTLTR